ncbi:MAG: hypothetical protein ACXVAX_01595 [Pseudobdellovibrio sp.]
MSNKYGIGPGFKIFLFLFVFLPAVWFISGFFGKKTQPFDNVTSKIKNMGGLVGERKGALPGSQGSVSGATTTTSFKQQPQNQPINKVVDKNKLQSIRAQHLMLTFKRLTSQKSLEERQEFFGKTHLDLNIPGNFKSIHRNIEGKGDMLFSFDADQMTSYKVLTKNGYINDQDKKFLQDEVLGFDLSEYEQIDAKKELNLNYDDVKVFKGTKANFMSFGVLIYDKKTDKTVALVFDGQPAYVLKNLPEMINSVNSLNIKP